MRRQAPRIGFGFVAVAVFGAAAFALAPDTMLEAVPTKPVERDLTLPPALTPGAETERPSFWRRETIARGDTLGSVLARLGVDDPAALRFVNTDAAAHTLYQLRPGKSLSVRTDDAGTLIDLRFVSAAGGLLSISREGDHFNSKASAGVTAAQWEMATGEIRSSLFGAADAAGLPDPITMQLADVFSGEIDFYKDIQRGDRFAVIYEMRYVDGEPAGIGQIVAASFENRGRKLTAFLWRDADGTEGYYADDGVPLHRAFLRAPLAFSRITSGFSLARFHPILQMWKAHKGVDYAAPIGTPVRATSNGTVLFVGQQTGYGNVIHLKHAGAYSTLYAHLSRFAPRLKTGSRVTQGEIIGYVGQTGWATGPHLHYEFRVANVQRDPLTIALPAAEPLAPATRAAFRERIGPAAIELAAIRRVPVAFAAAD